MGMERIERCSKHDISEEKSAQNFQTSTSPNPVLPINLKDPGIWKTLEWQLKKRGVLNPLKTRRHKTEVVTLTNYLQKQVACWNGKWICSVVLASFEVGLEKAQEGFNYYLFREESWLLKWKFWNCPVPFFAKRYVCIYPLIAWYQMGPQFEIQTSTNETLSSQDNIFSYI